MYKNIRMITLDMDDTLLRTDKTISDYTLRVLQKAINCGILVVPCSGRAFDYLPDDIYKLNRIRYAINLNGGVITQTDPKSILSINAMSVEEGITVYKKLYTCFASPITVFTEGPAYVQEDLKPLVPELAFPGMIPYYYKSRTYVKDIVDTLKTGRYKPIKLGALLNHNGSDRRKIAVARTMFPEFSIADSPDMFEVTALGVNKGNGLKTLCEIVGIPIEETMAFGDSDNDASILKMAGCAVAVSNATESLKKMADYITESNNDDGVAHAIEKLIFGIK